MKKILFTLPMLFLLTACPDMEPSAEEKQEAKTNQLLKEADAQLGMPAIVNFQEKRMAKDMIELRDKAVPTHAYLFSSQRGCLVYLGTSIGYGLPYSTQYTSPEKLEIHYQNPSTIPQAEPNGLYMPEQAAATWVMLYDPATKKTNPTYVEQDVLISPTRLVQRECN